MSEWTGCKIVYSDTIEFLQIIEWLSVFTLSISYFENLTSENVFFLGCHNILEYWLQCLVFKLLHLSLLHDWGGGHISFLVTTAVGHMGLQQVLLQSLSVVWGMYRIHFWYTHAAKPPQTRSQVYTVSKNEAFTVILLLITLLQNPVRGNSTISF